MKAQLSAVVAFLSVFEAAAVTAAPVGTAFTARAGDRHGQDVGYAALTEAE